MDELDRVLVNRLQEGVEVVERPFAAIAAELGIPEAEVCGRLQRLVDDGLLTRFGPMIDAEALGGAFTLAAMSVPAHDFERVAGLVNAHPEVAHNYRREHRFNMWFVVAAERPEGIGEVLKAIEHETGYRALDLPKRREYYLRLKLDAGAAR
ncbi:MAG TPA: AsnC family transcriptional regulator [Burkholderiales bacterium]|nr:AsnC family transcriptional regulator [Burkholderiales bacterium]